MYFKLRPGEQKYLDMGMVEVEGLFYLEEGDEGYEKYLIDHYITVPVIPDGGYPGDCDEFGNPVDIDAYKTWRDNLSTVQQLIPFCHHSIQFEPDVTDEEILWCFELALYQTHYNYMVDDLHCKKGTTAKKVNQDIGYISRKAFFDGVSQIPAAVRTKYENVELAKVPAAKTRYSETQGTDFTAVQVESAIPYSVRA